MSENHLDAAMQAEARREEAKQDRLTLRRLLMIAGGFINQCTEPSWPPTTSPESSRKGSASSPSSSAYSPHLEASFLPSSVAVQHQFCPSTTLNCQSHAPRPRSTPVGVKFLRWEASCTRPP
jgi:hypothetical protein